MNTKHQHIIMFCIVMCTLWLTGCSATIPLTHYYTFQPREETSEQTGSPTYPYIIGIETFDATGTYQQDKIVYRPSSYEVSFYEYRRWLRPPSEFVTEHIRHQLKQSGLFKRVHDFGFSVFANYVLRGKIVMFDQWFQSTETSSIRVKIQYQLIDFESENILWMDYIETDVTVTVTALDILETVKGFETAVDKNIELLLQALEQQFTRQQ